MTSTTSAPGAALAVPPVTSQPEVPGHPVARLLVMLIRTYQLARLGRVSPCRFTPTCSHYAIEAMSHHGAWRGLGLTLRRLGRCRPGGPSGYDPVPKHPSPRMRNT
jgi:putative membrane protein insertion efficiency factor